MNVNCNLPINMWKKNSYSKVTERETETRVRIVYRAKGGRLFRGHVPYQAGGGGRPLKVVFFTKCKKDFFFFIIKTILLYCHP